MSDDYDAYRAAVKNNPELPLTWQQVVRFDRSFDAQPELKQKLVESFERIQSTMTGQDVLRSMMTRRETPLVMKFSESRQGSGASYDSFPHEIEVNPGIDESTGGPGKPTFDQYVIHELGHGATSAPTYLKDAQSKTMADHIFVGAGNEKMAEEITRRYASETGDPATYQYVGESQIGDLIKLGFSEKDLAKNISYSVLTQQTIDGATREEALKALDREVLQVKEKHGVDLRQAVRDHLASPAPQVDDHDHIIAPDQDKKRSDDHQANAEALPLSDNDKKQMKSMLAP